MPANPILLIGGSSLETHSAVKRTIDCNHQILAHWQHNRPPLRRCWPAPCRGGDLRLKRRLQECLVVQDMAMFTSQMVNMKEDMRNESGYIKRRKSTRTNTASTTLTFRALFSLRETRHTSFSHMIYSKAMLVAPSVAPSVAFCTKSTNSLCQSLNDPTVINATKQRLSNEDPH